jgi:hypothetical protein
MSLLAEHLLAQVKEGDYTGGNGLGMAESLREQCDLRDELAIRESHRDRSEQLFRLPWLIGG